MRIKFVFNKISLLKISSSHEAPIGLFSFEIFGPNSLHPLKILSLKNLKEMQNKRSNGTERLFPFLLFVKYFITTSNSSRDQLTISPSSENGKYKNKNVYINI